MQICERGEEEKKVGRSSLSEEIRIFCIGFATTRDGMLRFESRRVLPWFSEREVRDRMLSQATSYSSVDGVVEWPTPGLSLKSLLVRTKTPTKCMRHIRRAKLPALRYNSLGRVASEQASLTLPNLSLS